MSNPVPTPWRLAGPVIPFGREDGREYLIIRADENSPEGPREVALLSAWDLEGEVDPFV
jgi:hypothetical protein